MAEKQNISKVVAGLKRATSAEEVFAQAHTLAGALSPTPITQFVLAASIAMSVARVRYQEETLQRDEFIRVGTRANGAIEAARRYLTFGEGLVGALQEEASFVADKAIHDTGAPLEEEIGVSRTIIVQHEIGVPLRVLRAASVDVLRRGRN